MKKIISRLVFSLLTVLWAYLIFYLSSLPDLSSSWPWIYDLIARKLGHIGVFGVLAYLLARTFDRREKEYLIFYFFAAVAYAVSDEWHQTGVVGRNGSGLDVVIDSIGIYSALSVYKNSLLSKFFGK